MTLPRIGVGPQEVTYGGHDVFWLTNAMGTTPQQVKAGSGRIFRIHNNQGDASVSLTVYDAGATDAGTLSSANVIWKGTLPTSGPLDLQHPFLEGCVVEAAAAVPHSLSITTI